MKTFTNLRETIGHKIESVKAKIAKTQTERKIAKAKAYATKTQEAATAAKLIATKASTAFSRAKSDFKKAEKALDQRVSMAKLLLKVEAEQSELSKEIAAYEKAQRDEIRIKAEKKIIDLEEKSTLNFEIRISKRRYQEASEQVEKLQAERKSGQDISHDSLTEAFKDKFDSYRRVEKAKKERREALLNSEAKARKIVARNNESLLMKNARSILGLFPKIARSISGSFLKVMKVMEEPILLTVGLILLPITLTILGIAWLFKAKAKPAMATA